MTRRPNPDDWHEFYRLLRTVDRHIRDMREIAARLAVGRQMVGDDDANPVKKGGE